MAKTLEEVTNEALLQAVAEWLEHHGLKLVAHKTEAVVLARKRRYVELLFILNGIKIIPKDNLRYPDAELSRKLGFQTHLRIAAEKAGKTVNMIKLKIIEIN